MTTPFEPVALPVSHPTPVDPRDWVAMGLVGGGFVSSWVWVFIHPSAEAFGICVGGVGTFGAIFHWLCVHDAKTADAPQAAG